MLTIIPALEILKAVTDSNIDSAPGAIRRHAFDVATDLQSRNCDVQILLDGHIFARISSRLNADQQTFFRRAYRVDESATGVTGLNHNGGICFVAKSE